MKGHVSSLFPIAVLLCGGCLRGDSAPVSNTQPVAEPEFVGGRVELGSPALTAGIPGQGPLEVSEIRRWLANPHVHQPLDFTLPPGLADAAGSISIPPENPLTLAKIELGRQLFFDKRLSGFETFACATCHRPDQDYSAHTVMPDVFRNPSVVFNRLLGTRQFWDGRAESLEEQPKSPLNNPFEMNTTPDECVATLRDIEGYRLQFEAIFGRLDFQGIQFALASFQRAIVTGNSAWDDHRLLAEYETREPAGLTEAEQQTLDQLRRQAVANPMSAGAIRGETLFFSDRTQCSWCHVGPNLTDELFHNVGIGMSAEQPPLGRHEFTLREEDHGAFKTPTLRNVARTSPYMHDGSLPTLEAVVDWFCQGGFAHEHLDEAIQPIDLTPGEKQDLIEFLHALNSPLPPVESNRLPE